MLSSSAAAAAVGTFQFGLTDMPQTFQATELYASPQMECQASFLAQWNTILIGRWFMMCVLQQVWTGL